MPVYAREWELTESKEERGRGKENYPVVGVSVRRCLWQMLFELQDFLSAAVVLCENTPPSSPSPPPLTALLDNIPRRCHVEQSDSRALRPLLVVFSPTYIRRSYHLDLGDISCLSQLCSSVVIELEQCPPSTVPYPFPLANPTPHTLFLITSPLPCSASLPVVPYPTVWCSGTASIFYHT